MQSQEDPMCNNNNLVKRMKAILLFATVWMDFEGVVAVVVQSLSRVRLFETPWTTARQDPFPSLSPGVAQIHVH